MVTDEPLEVTVPQFSQDEVTGIADLIESILAKKKADDIDVVVNGAATPLSPSQQDLLRRTLLAMLPAPDDGIRSLHVSLRRRA